MFCSSDDNEACATEFVEALGRLGIPATRRANADGSHSVIYEVEDMKPLIALMIEIERKHSKPGTRFAGDGEAAPAAAAAEQAKE